MCRWLAYQGAPISLDTLLTKPQHSLLDQSMNARLNYVPGVGNLAVNGDGFGVGWYLPGDPIPARYRSIRPAWNDENLRDLARSIQSPHFMAHVRTAPSGSEIQRSNCHPFQYERWLFVHNGSIPEFDRVARELRLDVDPALFPYIRGATDSETCFYLALTYGLNENPPAALRRMAERVEAARVGAGIQDPVQLTCAATDGCRLYAMRYSSHRQSKTLFYSSDFRAIRELNGDYETFPEGGLVIVSEPLDSLSDKWVEIPESSIIMAEAGCVMDESFGWEI